MKKYLIPLFLAIFLTATLVGLIIIQQPKPIDGSERLSNIIQMFQDLNYTFVLPRDYFAGSHPEKTVLLIHDADFWAGNIEAIMRIEEAYGVRSAFYPRPDTEWFSQSVAEYQEAERQGWEIGYQYCCLSRSDGDMTLAQQQFKGQLLYMRQLFNVKTTTYHGDNYNLKINNYELYNQELWRSLDLNEVYSLKDYSYITDTNNKLVTQTEYGNLVIVQLHADYIN